MKTNNDDDDKYCWTPFECTQKAGSKFQVIATPEGSEDAPLGMCPIHEKPFNY